MLAWVTKFPVPKKLPKVGDLRVKRRFLLFPKSIAGITKWLGVAYWEERCEECLIMDMSGPHVDFYPDMIWEPTKWLRDRQHWLERKWEENLNQKRTEEQN